MAIYVAEIGGRGIAATSADSRAEAEAYFLKYGPFSDDEHLLESERRLLWEGEIEGRKAILVRVASLNEMAVWNDRIGDMIAAGHLDKNENGKDVLMYLVPVEDRETGHLH